MAEYDIYDAGFSKNLDRSSEPLSDTSLSIPALADEIKVGEFQSGGSKDLVEQVASSQAIISGPLSGVVNITVGNVTADGIAGEHIATPGLALYVKASDGRLYKSIATGDESTYSFVGISQMPSAGVGTPVTYSMPGFIAKGLSGLTIGAYYFISNTAGTLSTTPGTRIARVGMAVSATEMRVIQPNFIRRGYFQATEVGDTVVTTGFYPVHIDFRGGIDTSGGTKFNMSVGDDTNSGVFDGTLGSYSNTYALRMHNHTDATDYFQGSVTSRSATGFTFNSNVTAGISAQVQWVARSG